MNDDKAASPVLNECFHCAATGLCQDCGGVGGFVFQDEHGWDAERCGCDRKCSTCRGSGRDNTDGPT